MVVMTRETAESLLKSVRTPIDRLGIQVSLSVAESQAVLEAYIESDRNFATLVHDYAELQEAHAKLQAKFDRATACR